MALHGGHCGVGVTAGNRGDNVLVFLERLDQAWCIGEGKALAFTYAVFERVRDLREDVVAGASGDCLMESKVAAGGVDEVVAQQGVLETCLHVAELARYAGTGCSCSECGGGRFDDVAQLHGLLCAAADGLRIVLSTMRDERAFAGDGAKEAQRHEDRHGFAQRTPAHTELTS